MKQTKFWDKGFEILQNMQDRKTLDKSAKRARDFATKESINNTPEDNGHSPMRAKDDDMDPNSTLIDECSETIE